MTLGSLLHPSDLPHPVKGVPSLFLWVPWGRGAPPAATTIAKLGMGCRVEQGQGAFPVFLGVANRTSAPATCPSRGLGASRLCTALRLPGGPASGWRGLGLPQGSRPGAWSWSVAPGPGPWRHVDSRESLAARPRALDAFGHRQVLTGPCTHEWERDYKEREFQGQTKGRKHPHRQGNRDEMCC